MGYRGAGALHDIINLPVIFFASIHLLSAMNNDRPLTTIGHEQRSPMGHIPCIVTAIHPSSLSFPGVPQSVMMHPMMLRCHGLEVAGYQKTTCELGTKHVLSHTQPGVSVI